jgi:hypothetical protein
MKTYLVYVDGVEQSKPIKAASHNAAEKKARQLYPGKSVQVAYAKHPKAMLRAFGYPVIFGETRPMYCSTGMCMAVRASSNPEWPSYTKVRLAIDL